MSNIGLGTTLKRLSQNEGEWVLEVERLVPLGRHLHQPVEQKIEGASLIARHLRTVPELGAMAEETESLMNSGGGADAYEIWKGAWLDVEMVRILSLDAEKNSDLIRSAPAAGGASRKAVAKLERSQAQLVERIARLETGGGELQRMNALVDSLSAKVSALEAKLGMDPAEVAALVAAHKESAAPASDPAQAAPDLGGQAAAPSKESSTSPKPSVEAVDTEAAEVEQATAESAGEAVDPEEAAADFADPEQAVAEAAAEVASESEKEPVRPEKRMRPPSPIAMRQSLEMLVGEDVGLKEREKHADFSEGIYYGVRILDDNDVLVGTMVADLVATIRLACKLLMLPEGEVKEQIAANEASEDSIETMSEIFNTLSATINNVKTNPHVRTTPMERFNLDDFAWVVSTKRRTDVDVEGGGIMSISAV